MRVSNKIRFGQIALFIQIEIYKYLVQTIKRFPVLQDSIVCHML
jgi:hypothetical protein